MTLPETSYRTIPLTQGQVAIIDAADYDWLSRFNWQAQWNKYTRSYYASRRGGIYMHREILGLAKGDPRRGDHREPSQTLDNRRSNLRIATRRENKLNSRTRRDSKTGIKGVTLDARVRRWQARITVGGKRISLGCFPTLQAARVAYVVAAKQYHGEFARTA